MDAAIEKMLRRDRLIVSAGLGVIVILAWLYLFSISVDGSRPDGMDGMGGAMPMDVPMNMDMRDGRMMDMDAIGDGWSSAQIWFAFAMWTVMMIGMMTPSVAPIVLVYARVARAARGDGKPFASTGWFFAGYLLAWTAFAAVATLAQAGLASAHLLASDDMHLDRVPGAVLLIIAGVYQWSPLKNACLAQCQSPFQFIQRHGGFRAGRSAALRLGLQHGLYCIGCCWALMLMLFVAGVMNLLLVAGLSILILAEKLLPAGLALARAVGVVMVLAGIALGVGWI